jgi:hypothetical protein
MEAFKRKFRKTLRDLHNFTRREDGLVTVEWVTLTASMVVAAVVVSYTVMHHTNAEAQIVGTGVETLVNNVYGVNGSKL